MCSYRIASLCVRRAGISGAKKEAQRPGWNSGAQWVKKERIRYVPELFLGDLVMRGCKNGEKENPRALRAQENRMLTDTKQELALWGTVLYSWVCDPS